MTSTVSEKLKDVSEKMKDEMAAAAVKVAMARKRHEELSKAMALSRIQWAKDNAALTASIGVARQAKEKAESALRGTALHTYVITGVKTGVCAGVGVKERRAPYYHTATAIQWALETDQLQFLELNKGLFKKHALAVAETAPLDFVEIEKEPYATIAKDMSGWEAKEKEEEARDVEDAENVDD